MDYYKINIQLAIRQYYINKLIQHSYASFKQHQQWYTLIMSCSEVQKTN